MSCKHEEKYCPRCKGSFECKPGDITNCHCSGIALSAEVKAHIAKRYEDCLCGKCLQELSNKYNFFKEKFLL